MKTLIRVVAYIAMFWYTYDDSLAYVLQAPWLGMIPWPVIFIPAIIAIALTED